MLTPYLPTIFRRLSLLCFVVVHPLKTDKTQHMKRMQLAHNPRLDRLPGSCNVYPFLRPSSNLFVVVFMR